MTNFRADDGWMLIELEKVRHTPAVDDAFAWEYRHLLRPGTKPDTLKGGEVDEAEEKLSTIGSFFETAGTLVRNGLLNEELFFDRYAVEPHWKLSKAMVDVQRKKAANANVAENFEWLAMREPEVQARLEERSRRESSRRKNH